MEVAVEMGIKSGICSLLTIVICISKMGVLSKFYRSGGECKNRYYTRVQESLMDTIKKYRCCLEVIEDVRISLGGKKFLVADINVHRAEMRTYIEEIGTRPEVIERQKELVAMMPNHSRKFLENCKLGLLEFLLKDLGYNDVEIIEDIARGFSTMSSPQPSNIFEKKTDERLQKEGEQSKNKKRKLGKLIHYRKGKPSFDDTFLREVEENFVQKFEKGLCSKFYTEEEMRKLSPKAISYAFPHIQKKWKDNKWQERVRTIVDERVKNLLVTLFDQIRLEDTRVYLEIIALLGVPFSYLESDNWSGLLQHTSGLAKSIGAYQEALIKENNKAVGDSISNNHVGPYLAAFDHKITKEETLSNNSKNVNPNLGLYCGDMIDAYDALFVKDHLENCIGFWSFRQNEPQYMYVFQYCLTFGSSVSVHGFLRFSNALVFVLRTLFLAILCSFYDDFNGFEEFGTCESGFMSLLWLFRYLGFQMHQQPPKSLWGRKAKILGVLWDLGETNITVDLPFEKRELIASICDNLIEFFQNSYGVAADGASQVFGPDPVYPTKELQKLVGNLVFFLHVVLFRAGYHVIRPLFRLSNEGYGPELVRRNKNDVIQYLFRVKRLAYDLPPYFYNFKPWYEDTVRCITDASTEPRIGGIIVYKNMRIGFSTVVPIAPGPLPLPTIMWLEVCVAWYLIAAWGHLLKNKRVLFLVDNTSGCYSIIGGYCLGCVATSKLVYEIHLSLAKLDCIVFWEYVFTKHNMADGLTHDKMIQDTLEKFNIKRIQINYPLPAYNS